jgi:tRNA A-37 threonylcarbamoyl transferase component Bud32/tetratricopeptide (TPR) repeat protein
VGKDPTPSDGSHTTADTIGTAKAAESALAAGTQLAGRYTVLSVLGRGGMGSVYAAYDAKLDRRVALKLLHPELSREPGSGPSPAELRLLREAHAMARINHPNVVNLYDVGQLADGQIFLALELVEGETLRQWLQEQQRPWREVLDVFVDAGRGLAAAHAAGLVHRDFKPSNVLLGKDGRARVTDFGVVRLHSEQPDDDAVAARPPSGERLRTPITEAGTVAGTPRYMAPESFDGRPADRRSDIYAFCLSLYEALYGHHPFIDESGEVTKVDSPLDGIPSRDVPLPSSPSPVPLWVGRAVVDGLRFNPDQRPESMNAVLAALRRDRRNQPTRLALYAVAASVIAITTMAITAWRVEKTSREQLCQGSAQQLAGVWDDAARQRVEGALMATKQLFAANAWRNLRETLDRYARAWIDMHHDSCMATRLRGDQSDAVMTLRMVCLDKRRQSLAALVEVLVHADATVVERAEQAVTGLPSLDRCADVPALLTEVPPPEDATVLTRVQEIRAQLARVVPLRLLGKTSDAYQLADRAIADARHLPYPPIIAEALLESARAHEAEVPAEAVPLYTEAVWTAQAGRDDPVAAAAAVGLVDAYGHLNQPSEWKLWQDYATAALKRIGGDDELEAELWSAIGQCHHEQGRYADAFAAHEKALSLLQRHFGPRDVRTLVEERSALTALNNIGKEEEARGRKLRLLTRTEELLGPNHPAVARMLISVGFSDGVLGHFAEGREVLERAATILRNLGVSSPVAG